MTYELVAVWQEAQGGDGALRAAAGDSLCRNLQHRVDMLHLHDLLAWGVGGPLIEALELYHLRVSNGVCGAAHGQQGCPCLPP